MAERISERSKTILDKYQIRKSEKGKAAFRSWLCEVLEQEGYTPVVEEAKSLVTSHNVVVGDPGKAKVILGAHYDTCAVMPIPNFITPRNFGIYLLYQLLMVIVMVVIAAVPAAVVALLGAPEPVVMLVWYAALIFCIWWLMAGKANRHTVNDNTSGVITLLETALALPREQRERVCFVFFDNEEIGLLGSASFFKMRKKDVAGTLMLNFDCVSDGDYIQFYPGKNLKKDEAALQELEQMFVSTADKMVEVVRGFSFYPSDQRAFPRGVGVCALKKKPIIGYYMDRIHTGRDTVLEEDNLILLRDGVLRLVDHIEK